MPGDEHYFGLGDKAGTFDRRNQAYTLWNTDVGTQESIDPIYKSIPFFLAYRRRTHLRAFPRQHLAHLVRLRQAVARLLFFRRRRRPARLLPDLQPHSETGRRRLRLPHRNPSAAAAVDLGFQQSRYSYTPESQICAKSPTACAQTEFLPMCSTSTSTIRTEIAPSPSIRRPFQISPAWSSDLRKQHFHLVLITDLHIAHAANQGYAPYDSGEAGDHFVKKADGSEFVGIVWPGPAVFPDFTRAKTRQWWGGLYKDFVQNGIAGFWNDMNEPAVFDGPGKTMPLDNIHRIDEPGFAKRTATHAEIHNIVGLENARATYEGLLKLRPDERPFVLTRATFAGGQRYGFTWTGDNSATWNHLRLATQQLLNLGLSGISFVGDDIGGFNGSPPPDLLTRWIEIGSFNPLFRDHSTKGSLMQEVWVHGPEQEAIRRRYIETRYRLLPYIYTLADESSRTGIPMVRPIFLEFPEVFTPPSGGFAQSRYRIPARSELAGRSTTVRRNDG